MPLRSRRPRLLRTEMTSVTELGPGRTVRFLFRAPLLALLAIFCTQLAPAGAGDETPRFTNRLAQETSPYLLLHAHNPVDWYPWGPEAFERAKAEGKPIFLSIGYSSCHWCHVMERESFSDPEIAAYLNAHFINVKVDREERPDVDEIYMTALQVYYQLVGQPQAGGWPLSIFLTPDAKPFFGGTYFPPQARRGMAGLLDVATRVAEAWAEQRGDLEAAADHLTDVVKQSLAARPPIEAVRLEPDTVDAVVRVIAGQYDPVHGGFGFDPHNPHRPKFPNPPTLELLLDRATKGGDAETLAMLRGTLDAMAAGGIYDHVGGGFHRYSTDRAWRIPHFEKMLYDNAQLARIYARAFESTGDAAYRRVAEDTLRFVAEEMTSPDGAFYSALDADTDGKEGRYYTWTEEQITAVLGPEKAKRFEFVYGVVDEPNFEETNVLYLPRPVSESAAQLGIEPVELREELDASREQLLKARRSRPKPLRDTKVLTGWNGLMIAALADAGHLLHEPAHVASAARAADFVLRRLRTEDGRLLRVYAAAEAKLNAYSVDYAFLVDGLLALDRATGEPRWLTEARALTDRMIEDFWDESSGGFFFTSDDHEALLARSKDPFDSVTPSPNSVAIRNLVRLAERTGDETYREHARLALERLVPIGRQSPASIPTLARALGEWLDAGQRPAAKTAERPLTAEDLSSLLDLSGGKQVSADDTAPSKESPVVTAKGAVSVDRLPTGGTFQVAAVVKIKPNWHINANPASPDFLIPTTLKVTSDLPIEVEKVAYPKGEPLEFPGLEEPIKVYTGTAVLRARLTLSKELAARKGTLQLEVGYQACDDLRCLAPTNVQVKLAVEIAPAGEPVKPTYPKLFPPEDAGAEAENPSSSGDG